MSTTSAVSQMTSATDPANAAELAKLPGFDRKVKKTLDQGDFLKLLATQLANQDPLNPSNDLNSISQMATFSSVEQMGDLVTSLKAFIVSQDFASAQSMLGRHVTVTQDKTTASGIVTAVGYDKEGKSIIRIGDRTFSPADVTEIRDAAPAATAAETAETAA